MTKKVRDDDDDDFENELDESQNDTEKEIDDSDDDSDDSDDDSESGSRINDDDDDNLDIIIEIDEDDLDLTTESDIVKPEEGETETDDSEITLSKHKLEGKHSLKYDSIFKGKKEDPLSEENNTGFDMYHKDTIEVDKSSSYYFESMDNEKYIRAKLVKERVYDILTENTGINFLNNRRKPSRSDFNQYYNLLRDNLKDESFTNIELFNELAVYFSDNLFNMFKLLDKKWRNLIIFELQDHIGKNANSKEVTNRNIYEGTEIEFEWVDEFNKEVIIITGVVVEPDYENSIFKVDSYENIYNVKLELITKILNNTKFKYNLNKLNNIDFL